MWLVYIVECCDNTYYTGITNNLSRRISAHNSGKGAKYTRGRRPVRLVWCAECSDKSDALRQEHKIKKMKRAEKLAMINLGLLTR